MSKSMFVVAAPGNSILLDVGGKTLEIGAFEPIDLLLYATAVEIKQCAGLHSLLNTGTLKLFTAGDDLPKSVNNVIINTLESVPQVKLETNYFQKSVVEERADVGIETSVSQTDTEMSKLSTDIAARVKAYKAQQHIRDAAIPTVAEDAEEPLPTIPVLKESDLVRPVMANVSEVEFDKFRAKTAKEASNRRKGTIGNSENLE